MKNNSYDITIIGSGISGLLLGSELSKSHSVLIIEQEKKIPQQKYWLTNEKCIENQKELKPFINCYYNHMDFISYDQISFRCYGKYLLWDSNKLVTYFKDIIKKNDGFILNSYKFYSYYYSNDSINILANDSIFRSSLLIDCMGYSSPIIYAKNIIDIKGIYILFGKKLELKKNIDPICLHNVVLNHNPRYLEIFPLNNNFAYASILVPQRYINSLGKIKSEFDFIISNTWYKNIFKQNKTDDKVFGIVPVGKIKKRTLDRIFFFGEAGQINPAATGTGLTIMLKTYKHIAKCISENIQRNSILAGDLHKSVHGIDNFNRNFQIWLYKDILNWNSDSFSHIVKKLKYIDNNIINDVLFGELDRKKIFNIDFIHSLIKNRSYFFIKPLIKSVFL